MALARASAFLRADQRQTLRIVRGAPNIGSVNGFTHKSDSLIASAATTAAAVLAANPGYDVPAALATALGQTGTNLAASIDHAKTARDAALAATNAKADVRASTLSTLTTVANVVYTNGTSDAMLLALGFSPRAATSRPTMPLTVSGLTATVGAEGVIRLEFKRSGNRASAIFGIERSLDLGATWTMVAAIGQTKASLTGYAPGMPVLFRVTTTNSVGTSLPSSVVGAYVGEAPTADAPVELRLAA